jgi:hypothetical protein
LLAILCTNGFITLNVIAHIDRSGARAPARRLCGNREERPLTEATVGTYLGSRTQR